MKNQNPHANNTTQLNGQPILKGQGEKIDLNKKNHPKRDLSFNVPTENTPVSDPRFKSPDDFLKSKAPKLTPQTTEKKDDIENMVFDRDPNLILDTNKSDLIESDPAKGTTPSKSDFVPIEDQRFLADELESAKERNHPELNLNENKSENSSLHYGMPDLNLIKTELEQERNGFVPFNEPQISLPAADLVSPQEEKNNNENHASDIEPTRPTIPQPEIKPSVNHSPDNESEIESWREYAAQVQQWEIKVKKILKNVSPEIKAGREARRELESLKSLLQIKEMELEDLRNTKENPLIRWLKGLRRPK